MCSRAHPIHATGECPIDFFTYTILQVDVHFKLLLHKLCLSTPILLAMGLFGIQHPPIAPPPCGVHQGMLQAIWDNKLVHLMASPTKVVSVVLVLMAPRMLLPGVMWVVSHKVALPIAVVLVCPVDMLHVLVRSVRDVHMSMCVDSCVMLYRLLSSLSSSWPPSPKSSLFPSMSIWSAWHWGHIYCPPALNATRWSLFLCLVQSSSPTYVMSCVHEGYVCTAYADSANVCAWYQGHTHH